MRDYVFYEQARLSTDPQNPLYVEKVVQDNELIRELYNALVFKILEHIEAYSATELIKILYELAQKKAI